MGTQTNLFEMAAEVNNRMEARFKLGVEQEKLLLDIVTKTVIVDRLVPPRTMRFLAGTAEQRREVRVHYNDASGTASGWSKGFSIHRHALNQLCQKVRLPMTYVNRLQEDTTRGMSDLLCDNLNTLFGLTVWPEATRFLHRIVGTELRGFLSRRYNRHLASAPLLRSFIDQCKAEGARPIEATSSPVRHALKCLIPKVFEAFPGEHVCIGIEWSNSDFGAAKLKVLQTLWRVGAGSASVIDEGLSRAHIGSVIEDSDIEMSDETARKEVEAQQSAVRDHVKEYLSQKTIDRLLVAIRAARDEQISWTSLVAKLREATLGKSDIEWMKNVLEGKAETIIDLPPVSYAPDGARVPNLYWAIGAIGSIAQKMEDPDRRLELQREAGKLLAAALGE